MRICKVDNCNREHMAKGFCNRHYQQFNIHGKPLNRSIRDSNEFIIKDNYCEIILYNNKHKEVGRALIDNSMIKSANNYKWYLMNTGYVATKYRNKVFLLHHLIIGCPINKLQTDHINRNRLDNRRCNLRIVTTSQNQMNIASQKNNTSGIKGIYWDKSRNKWHVEIMANYKKMHLGRYDDLEHAIKVRKNAEIKYHGEYAPI